MRLLLAQTSLPTSLRPCLLPAAVGPTVRGEGALAVRAAAVVTGSISDHLGPTQGPCRTIRVQCD